MSNICRFTVPASRDIESIIDYIADNRGLDAAENYLKKLINLSEMVKVGIANPTFGYKYRIFN